MSKARIVGQWIGLTPFFILIIALSILWWATGLNERIFYILALVILTAGYFSTQMFFYDLFEYGEKNLRSDKELLSYEMNEASLFWMFLSGTGFTFFAGGVATFEENPVLVLTGLCFLIVGNLVYNVFYYPRYRLLIRRRIAELDIKDKK